MTTMDASIIAINILLYGTAFILGFIVAKITSKHSYNDSRSAANDSFFKPSPRSKKSVEIDEKKFVTTISTDSLEKKGKELGSQLIVNDNVDVSVSKLAMLKKK